MDSTLDTPPISASAMAQLLWATPFRFSSEDQLQGAMEQLFLSKGIPHTREVRLSAKDRIDFMVGRIGIEVKVKQSAETVERQLLRYAQHEEVDSLILVTSRSGHRMIQRMANGKSVLVVYLIASIF